MKHLIISLIVAAFGASIVAVYIDGELEQLRHDVRAEARR